MVVIWIILALIPFYVELQGSIVFTLLFIVPLRQNSGCLELVLGQTWLKHFVSHIYAELEINICTQYSKYWNGLSKTGCQ